MKHIFFHNGTLRQRKPLFMTRRVWLLNNDLVNLIVLLSYDLEQPSFSAQ